MLIRAFYLDLQCHGSQSSVSVKVPFFVRVRRWEDSLRLRSYLEASW